jgi:hypothetical protein
LFAPLIVLWLMFVTSKNNEPTNLIQAVSASRFHWQRT